MNDYEVCESCLCKITTGIFIEGTGEHYCDEDCLKKGISSEEIKELEEEDLIYGFQCWGVIRCTKRKLK